MCFWSVFWFQFLGRGICRLHHALHNMPLGMKLAHYFQLRTSLICARPGVSLWLPQRCSEDFGKGWKLIWPWNRGQVSRWRFWVRVGWILLLCLPRLSGNTAGDWHTSCYNLCPPSELHIHLNGMSLLWLGCLMSKYVVQRSFELAFKRTCDFACRKLQSHSCV